MRLSYPRMPYIYNLASPLLSCRAMLCSWELLILYSDSRLNRQFQTCTVKKIRIPLIESDEIELVSLITNQIKGSKHLLDPDIFEEVCKGNMATDTTITYF